MLTLRRLTAQPSLYPRIIKHLKMSQTGDQGSDAGKCGGGDGAIRQAGGGFGRMEAAREEDFVYKKQKEQLKMLKIKTDAEGTKTTAKPNK